MQLDAVAGADDAQENPQLPAAGPEEMRSADTAMPDAPLSVHLPSPPQAAAGASSQANPREAVSQESRAQFVAEAQTNARVTAYMDDTYLLAPVRTLWAGYQVFN